MGITTIKRRRKNGSIAYRMTVRIMRDGQVVLNTTRTFDELRLGRKWANDTEANFLSGDPPSPPIPAIRELIDMHLDRLDQIKPAGRTVRLALLAIGKGPLGQRQADQLAASHIIDYCHRRRQTGLSPATAHFDFVALQGVFSTAKAFLGLPIDDSAFREARPLATRLGLIARPVARNRRPDNGELDRILAYCRARFQRRPGGMPLHDLIEFAIHSAMRLGEICRIQWADLDLQRNSILIRHRKAPKGQATNDQRIPLFPPALAVVMRQPQINERIFPYDPASASTAFTRVCRQLGIEDLEFRDLRRHAATLLQEAHDFTEQETMAVTGHKSTDILREHYTALDIDRLHQKFNRK